MATGVFRWALLGALASVTLAACGKKETMAERFPGPWQSSKNERLAKLLAANNVTGCEAPYWRTYHDEPSTELLVYCSTDGKTWTAWLIWGSIKKVMGPTEPFADIPPPNPAG